MGNSLKSEGQDAQAATRRSQQECARMCERGIRGSTGMAAPSVRGQTQKSMRSSGVDWFDDELNGYGKECGRWGST